MLGNVILLNVFLWTKNLSHVVFSFICFREMVGPGTQEQWLYWTSPTEDQRKRAAVKTELEKLLATDYVSSKV